MNGRYRRIKVSVVVPAHNEEGNIEALMTEFDNTFRNANLAAEVVLVNDGSTDRTELKMIDAIRRYPWVRMVKNRVRMGLTTSLNKGFAAARGEILVFYPADLQFHPRDIPRMIDAIDNGTDMVCGKKIGAYGKWLVSWFYNLMTRLLFPKLKVTDMNSVKAFTREVYHDLPTMREGWHRYLAVFAASKGYIVREVPVTLHKRHSGRSKFRGTGRILKGLTDLVAVKFQVSVFGDPMHLFGKWSLLFFLAGLIVAGVAFYERFALQHGYRPLLYAVIMLELSALITFVMGIITEALVYLRDSLIEMREQNHRLTEQVERLGSHTPRKPIHEKSESEPPMQQQERSPQDRGHRNDRDRDRRPPRRPYQRRDRRDLRPAEVKMRELPAPPPAEGRPEEKRNETQ